LLLLLSIYFQSCPDASWSTWHQNDPLCSRDVQLKDRLLRILGCFATPASMSSPWVKISTPRAWSINPASVCNKSDSNMPRALSPQISVFQRASQIRSVVAERLEFHVGWVPMSHRQPPPSPPPPSPAWHEPPPLPPPPVCSDCRQRRRGSTEYRLVQLPRLAKSRLRCRRNWELLEVLNVATGSLAIRCALGANRFVVDFPQTAYRDYSRHLHRGCTAHSLVAGRARRAINVSGY